jgi:dGTPase
MSVAERYIRLHGSTLTDNRTASQIDRDRVMYTSAFRRLANVTQVVSGDDIHVFHNRLTHTLQVAQVARRIAEFLVNRDPKLKRKLDPDVCEAASLAHDLGHPPFGHLAEKALNEKARSVGLIDGFEGNAQSFRIVTKLAAHDGTNAGLDLTRATLNALLKYPWQRGQNGTKSREKWGGYSSEKKEFDWARELSHVDSRDQCLEAQIMDWADDVTYSVHDLEDFFKAGLIPLDRLASSEEDRQAFCAEVFQRNAGKLPASPDDLSHTFNSLANLWYGFQPYSGAYWQRTALKAMASTLIGQYVTQVQVKGREKLDISARLKSEIFMLKQLTWHFVILNPALATQQHGQELVINGLFDVYREAVEDRDDRSLRLFPRIYRDSLFSQREKESWNKAALIRTVIDMIASMTESQAIQLYHRLNGMSNGSGISLPLR